MHSQNICQEESRHSNLGKLLTLKAERSEDNTFSIVTWSPYETWVEGVSEYILQIASNGGFIDIASLSGKNLIYHDQEFTQQISSSRCYRVKAIQKNGKWTSYSNMLCLPLAPLSWIPASFTPNGDGLNDEFSIITKGADLVEMTIDNRWGEKVFVAHDGMAKML